MDLSIKMNGYNERHKDFEFEAKSNGEVLRGITAFEVRSGVNQVASAKIELEFFRDEDGLDIHFEDIDATATVVIGGKTYELVEVVPARTAHLEVSEVPQGSTVASVVGKKLNDDIMGDVDDA